MISGGGGGAGATTTGAGAGPIGAGVVCVFCWMAFIRQSTSVEKAMPPGDSVASPDAFVFGSCAGLALKDALFASIGDGSDFTDGLRWSEEMLWRGILVISGAVWVRLWVACGNVAGWCIAGWKEKFMGCC